MAEDWERKLGRAARALKDAHAARDQAVRDASAAGQNPTQIARHVGLSRAQVYRILDAG